MDERKGFLWCKYSHHNEFQASSIISLNAQLERVVQALLWYQQPAAPYQEEKQSHQICSNTSPQASPGTDYPSSQGPG